MTTIIVRKVNNKPNVGRVLPDSDKRQGKIWKIKRMTVMMMILIKMIMIIMVCGINPSGCLHQENEQWVVLFVYIP